MGFQSIMECRQRLSRRHDGR